MDHSYSSTVPFRPLPPEVTSTGARIVSFLHSGGRAAVLVGAPGSGKTTTLDAVLAGMPAWVERVSNRIPQPLTLARILAQVGAPAGGDQGLSLIQTLADRAGPTEPAVLAVDDAHTLTHEALTALARVPGLGGPDLPGMVLLLAGEPELLRLLGAPGLSHLRGRAALTLRMPAPGTAHQMVESLAAEPSPLVIPAAPARRWPYIAGMAGMAVLAGALLLRPELSPAQPDPAPAAAGPMPSAPTAQVQPAPVPSVVPEALAPLPNPERTSEPVSAATLDTAPLPAPAPAAESPPDPEPRSGGKPASTAAQLRQGFDAFLNKAGRDTAQLTPAARETLFREYLQWRSRSAP